MIFCNNNQDNTALLGVPNSTCLLLVLSGVPHFSGIPHFQAYRLETKPNRKIVHLPVKINPVQIGGKHR